MPRVTQLHRHAEARTLNDNERISRIWKTNRYKLRSFALSAWWCRITSRRRRSVQLNCVNYWGAPSFDPYTPVNATFTIVAPYQEVIFYAALTNNRTDIVRIYCLYLTFRRVPRSPSRNKTAQHTSVVITVLGKMHGMRSHCVFIGFIVDTNTERHSADAPRHLWSKAHATVKLILFTIWYVRELQV